jgi:hypothetical protein
MGMIRIKSIIPTDRSMYSKYQGDSCHIESLVRPIYVLRVEGGPGRAPETCAEVEGAVGLSGLCVDFHLMRTLLLSFAICTTGPPAHRRRCFASHQDVGAQSTCVSCIVKAQVYFH